ncbi:MAG: hypothetical protein ACOX2O_03275 [Bdellovibrionota bacterium]|jgi:hypothetical protein
MSKNSKDKSSKVTGIKAPRVPTAIEQLSGVSSVEKTQKTSAISAVHGLSGTSRTHSINSITAANREVLHKMVHEEADKLFGKTQTPSQKREVIEKAVKMAIDAVAIEEENDSSSKKS